MRSFQKHPDLIANIALITFSVISFIATYQGMCALMSGLSNGVVATAFAHVFSGLFTFALQLLLVFAVKTFKSVPALLSRLYWLSIYLVCAFFSVGFGYSFWFEHIRAEDYGREMFDQQFNASLSKLTEFEQSYNQLADTMNSLAAYSEETAKIEREKGGTCGKSPQGEGPRMRLRQADARIFQSFVGHFEAKREEVRQMMTHLQGVASAFDSTRVKSMENDINQAVHKANALRNDPQLVTLKQTLATRLAEGRTGFNRDGDSFNCPDPVMETKGNAVQQVNLPSLEEVAFFDPHNPRESLYLAFGQLMALPSLVAGGLVRVLPMNTDDLRQVRIAAIREAQAAESSPESSRDFNKADAIPLLLGGMVDLLIFFSAVAKGGASLRNNSLRTLVETLGGQSQVDAEVWRSLSNYLKGKNTLLFHQLLHDYEIPYRRSRYVAVPYPTRTQEHKQLDRLLEAFRVVKAAYPPKYRVKLESLPEWWLDHNKDRLTDIKYVNLYQLNPKFTDELLMEFLHSCGGSGSSDQPPAEGGSKASRPPVVIHQLEPRRPTAA